MSAIEGRPLRADAERSIRAIMEAAERLLAVNPAATMEQIAEAAGVARATVHRRFASREALIEIMTTAAWRELDKAVDAARPYTAPPLVSLHQATANVLQTKTGWRFALDHVTPLSPQAVLIAEQVTAKCDALLRRARDAGILSPDADLVWTRRAYLALLNEACREFEPGDDPDTGAAQVIDTLMYGLAARRPDGGAL